MSDPFTEPCPPGADPYARRPWDPELADRHLGLIEHRRQLVREQQEWEQRQRAAAVKRS